MSLYSGEELEWQVEYALSQKHIWENKDFIGEITEYYVKPKTNWNIKSIDKQNYIAKEIMSGHSNHQSKLNNFPSVYYVSLEECVDRRNELENQFRKYDIVPKSIISKRFKDSNDVVTGKYVYQLNDGTKGCCVSHLKSIKDWYDTTDENYAFFCEDDLSLDTVPCWDFTWEEFVESIPEDADCVQLFTIRDEYDTFEIRERYWNDWGATAYILTRDYAKKLIDTYIKQDSYHLEIPDHDIMPLIENILFASVGKTYTVPLFVENINHDSTFVGGDDDVNNGQKTNHYISHKKVLDWWKSKEKPQESFKKNIVDCFIYYNEKELLELRVNLLKDYVDKFIIVDANYTFSGNPKEYSCKNVIKDLGLPNDIIEVFEIDLLEENLGNPCEIDYLYNYGNVSRERVQRDAISKCLATNKFDNDTIFIVSDCDEIIDPKYIPMMKDLVLSNRDKIFKADLVHLEGRADFCVYEKETNQPKEWRYSLFFCLKDHMEKVSLNDIRAGFNVPYEIVWPYTTPYTKDGVFVPGERMKNLGWHFSWMGDNTNRLLKSKSFSHSNQNIDLLIHQNYNNQEMQKYIENYVFLEDNLSPSGIVNSYIKRYPVEDLPEIIFTLPRVKNFLLPGVEKTQLEQLLHEYSLDTENPEHNFNLGLWYEKEGHTAPALSYFLRCAERAYESDSDLAYEALIRGSYCYEKQGTRDGSARSMLWQAQAFRTDRPEAYFLLSRFAERREWWQDCYMNADLALRYCNFDCPPLRTNVEYPGKHGLLFEKAVSAWWWGKSTECKSLFVDILENYNISDDDRKIVYNNLKKIGVEVSVKEKSADFNYQESFDWSSLTYEDIITIEREIVHEKVYRFWEDVKKDDVVLDIGASVGAYAVSILDQNPKTIYCVEPSEKLLQTLIKNCSNNDSLVCINHGIVDNPNDNINIFGGEEEFSGITFKNLIKNYSISHVNFMKVDCEGGEYSIFKEENMDFLKNNVDFIAMEVHLNYEGCREKFKKFRDTCLVQFNDYKVMSCTRQNISWGNSIDIKNNIFDDNFIDNYTCEFMIYINNKSRKKKFFDCGTHMFQGFKEIAKKYSIDKSWQCHCFEANPLTYEQSLPKYSELLNQGYNIEYFNNAVSDSNSEVNVNCVKAEYYDETESGSFTSQASNILSNRPEHCNDRQLIYDSSQNLVKSIDFSEHIKKYTSPEDFVVVKIDIEGSEFSVLDKLILDGTIKNIDEIYVEFHSRFFDDIQLYNDKIKEYERVFLQNNIKFTQWV